MDSKLSCDVVRDLIPLVKDDIASDESKRLVLEHTAECSECRKLLGEYVVLQISDVNRLFLKLKSRLSASSVFFMFAAMFIGLSLSYDADMFYNSLIMPIVGALGYGAFGSRAVFKVPIILTALNLSIGILNIIRGLEAGSFADVLSMSVLWAIIYSIFAIVGILIASLFHFAFKKEDQI